MNEPITKDSLTTLDDLKRAIAEKERAWVDDNVSDYGAAALRAEAWRTAFEWHVGLIKRHAALSEKVGAHLYDWIAIDREEEDGLALIREKLS